MVIADSRSDITQRTPFLHSAWLLVEFLRSGVPYCALLLCLHPALPPLFECWNSLDKEEKLDPFHINVADRPEKSVSGDGNLSISPDLKAILSTGKSSSWSTKKYMREKSVWRHIHLWLVQVALDFL